MPCPPGKMLRKGKPMRMAAPVSVVKRSREIVAASGPLGLNVVPLKPCLP
jgi:hypothetical protein